MSTENVNIVRLEEGAAVLLQPGLAPAALDLETQTLPDNAIVALPADRLRSLMVRVAPEEVKHLKQALPFMMEESLLDDVDALHFAHQKLDDERHAVAVIERETLAAWVAEMPDALREKPWISEALCLPWSEGHCTLVFEAEHVLIRWGLAEGARVEHALLPGLLDTLRETSSAYVAYGVDELSARGLLPQHVNDVLQWRQGGLPEALLLADAILTAPDLRQDSFAPKLPLMRWWGVWQRVAVALGVALILKTGVSVADYQTLKTEDLQLRQAMQDSYRRVNPRGAVVDVEKQLNRQLAEFGAGGQQSAFTPSLVALLTEISKVDGIALTSVNYSGGKDMRVNLSAPDFQSVERVREQLAQSLPAAELENSNARGDGVVARIRVELR
jgi:general secretion pathway protein L